MKRSLSLLFLLVSIVLFWISLSNPTSVSAYCQFGYCSDVNDIPNGGCPYNEQFGVQEVCSVQPPQLGACCAGPPSDQPPPPEPVCNPGERNDGCTGNCGGCSYPNGEYQYQYCLDDGSRWSDPTYDCNSSCGGYCPARTNYYPPT